jgi:hypothetical protein
VLGRRRHTALALLFAPHELGAPDVTEQLAQSSLRAAFERVRTGGISL